MLTRDAIVEELKAILDPELFLDIWFLGLIYNIDIKDVEASESKTIEIEMTFTSPVCPAGPQLIEEVKQRLGALPNVEAVNVNITFNPPWQPSDEVKGMLGMM